MAVETVFPNARTAWFCEWDDAPSKVLAHHWPDVPNLRDVTAVDWSAVEPVDIITGGFPCQDVSHAGRRQGLIRDGDGKTRSGLWGEMLKAIDTIRPPLVVAENVRGLLSAQADSDVEPCPFCMGDDGASPMRALGAVLADLADIGFDAAWAGVRAADVGAAHGRFRVFILAWPTAADSVGDGLEHAREQVGPGGPAATTGRDDAGGNGAGASAGLSVLRGRGVDAAQLRAAGLTLLPTPAARDWKDHQVQVAGHRPDDKDSINRAIAHLLSTPRTSDTNGPGVHGTGGQDLRTVIDLLPTPRVTTGGSIASQVRVRDVLEGRATVTDDCRLELTAEVLAHRGESWGDYAPAIARWERVLGRVAPAPTEPGPKGNPRLSPRFVEFLMGLPVGHVTDPSIGLTRNQQLKALGNGVVPQQGAAALEWLLSVEAVTS